jgi:predicted DNA-binding transcriptional regulator YafY
MSSRLQRLLWLDREIRDGSCPAIADLVAQFAISERTAYGDLSFFREVIGAPVRYRRKLGGYDYANPAWVLPAVLQAPAAAPAWDWLQGELAERLGPEEAQGLIDEFLRRLQR